GKVDTELAEARGRRGESLRPVRFRTLTGSGAGRFACDVPVQFSEAPLVRCLFDFFVTESLNERNYGLISLRDIYNNFSMEAEGRFRRGADNEPISLPVLRLFPRAGWQRIRYLCPACQLSAWGRPGLHLVCGDCNRQMVPT